MTSFEVSNMGPNNNETISSSSSIDEMDQHDKLNGAAECDKPCEMYVFPEQKKKQVSIDVTKALMVFGFSSWSALEEGTTFCTRKVNRLN